MFKLAWFSSPGAAVALLALAPPLAAAEPTRLWLERHGLQSWETVFDQDGDGFPTQAEFELGTDPLDPGSRPLGIGRAPDRVVVRFANTPGVRYRFEQSPDLEFWEPVPNLPVPDGSPVDLQYGLEMPRIFFRIAGDGLPDTDADGLLDFEEIDYTHTDPARSDTDGDGLTDGDEVLRYRSDPNRLSPTGRATLRGKVVLDEDRDPATRSHPGLPGWRVFLDLDRDGWPGVLEPMADTDPNGAFVFEQVDPGSYRVTLLRQVGWSQIFPTPNPPSSPDGYPDRVVAYLDSGLGPIAGPYGKNPDPLPGVRIVVGLTPEPVDPAIILGPPPPPPLVAPVGAYSHVDFLSLPRDSELTVRFEGEEVVDGPGPDLVLYNQGQGLEQAELYLGSSEADLTLATVVSERTDLLLDLEGLEVPLPVRVVKLKGLDLEGSFPGFELFAIEALNYEPQTRSHYEVTVAGGETITDLDFGVAGNDRPPRVFVNPVSANVRAGEMLEVQVTATDDRGVSATSLIANGSPVSLDASLLGTVPVTFGGLIELVATVTDTSGQTANALRAVVARNADGTVPDLSGLGVPGSAASGGPSIRILAPAVGAILQAPTDLVGTIAGTAQPVATWRVHYALADTVNPEALSEDDPDYALLAEGSGPVPGGRLGQLPADTLPPGAYLLRVAASDVNGITAYLGSVVGVRVEPLEIRPEIALTTPTNNAVVPAPTDVVGSIRTRQELREWFADVAPLSEVDLENLNGGQVPWRRIAGGTSPVEAAKLFRFDPTLLPNDTYVIRVSAWNRNGLGWAEPLVLDVAGNAKLGNFRVEFLDLDLPLAGISIQVRRVYDSLTADRPGDFGYGWSMALQDADIRETVPDTGSGFRSTPFRVGTRVYLNAPDGRRLGFTFQPELARVSLLGAAWKAVFVPDPGNLCELAVPEGDTAFLTIDPSSGAASLFFLAQPWNPDTYILTDRAGTRYTYSDREGLLEIEDPNGNRVTFSPTAIQHSGGPSIAIARDPAGRITSLTDPEGRRWLYAYDAAGDLERVTYPADQVATFAYAPDRAHFLQTIDDPLHGPAERIEYDEEGRIVAVIDAAGNRREQTMDPGTFTGSLLDARGNVTRFTYDQRGNIVREENPLGGVTQRVYGDARNPDRPTAVTEPNGNVTTYTYDSRGNVLEIERPARRSGVSYAYDAEGRMTNAAFGLVLLERFTYDDAGNPTRVDQGGRSWDLKYTSDGRLSSAMDGAGGLTRFVYDGPASRPSEIIAPDGGSRRFAYNARGQIVEFTDALGAVWRYAYDPLGRLVREIDPQGVESITTYHPTFPSLVHTRADRAGRLFRHEYDDLGRMVEQHAPGGAVTRYEYDANGNRTAVVDPLGQRTEFVYDALDRVVQETDPAGGQRRYAYDAAGNLVETVAANGRRRTYLYDTLNRRIEERWHDPSDDSVVRTIKLEYDRVDRLTRLEDPDATLTFSYLNGPRTPLLQSARATYPGRQELFLTYVYDGAGRLIQVGGTAFGGQMRLTRDAVGRLAILTADRGLAPGRVRLEFRRNARGDLIDLRRFNDENGIVPAPSTRFPDIDLRGWARRIEHFDSSGQPYANLSFTLERDAEAVVTNLLVGAVSQAFTYDAEGQLTRVLENGVETERYRYDLSGNRLASHRHPGYEVGAGNRLSQAAPWTLAYDGEGNLTVRSNAVTGEVLRFEWDHRNRLTRVTRTLPGVPEPTTITQYRYDPLDRRIAVEREGEVKWTYYDRSNPIADYADAGTTPLVRLVHGDGVDDLHALWPDGEGPLWTLGDHLGSVRQVVDADQAVVAGYDYDAYGNLRGVTGPRPAAAGRFGFTGRERDEATGLYYYRARYYDPDLGRFLSRDPRGLDAGDPNLYRYVRNSPVSLTDPTGQLGLIELFVIKEALFGAILAPSVDELATIGCRSALLYTEIAEVLAWWDIEFDYDAWWECDQ